MFVYINNKQLLFIAENKEANYCETHMYIIWNGYQNNETNKLILSVLFFQVWLMLISKTASSVTITFKMANLDSMFNTYIVYLNNSTVSF